MILDVTFESPYITAHRKRPNINENIVQKMNDNDTLGKKFRKGM
jgi:hypothetical protein